MNGQAPVAPDAQQAMTSAGGADGVVTSPHQLWGYYDILLDPDASVYEVFPRRDLVTHYNVLKYLEVSPCTNCLKVAGVTPSPTTLSVDIQIKHPFASLNLTGFDVRGIAMFWGSHTFAASGLKTSNALKGDAELLNADGYTTLYNPKTAGSGPGGLQGYFKGKLSTPAAPNSVLNGYKRYISSNPGNTRNAFYAGETVTQTFVIDKPTGSFIMGYAIDACWAPPKKKPVTNPMSDFAANANCPEPWKIEVTQTPIGDGLDNKGGSVSLEIRVYDRSGKASHGPVVVECPELFDGTQTASWLADATGYTKFSTVVTNAKLAPVGTYMCLISVEDNENASAPDWLDLTAYQIVKLTVNEHINKPPVAGASSTNYQPANGENFVLMDESTDPDGNDDIVLYEWDFSYNEAEGFHAEGYEKNQIYAYPAAGTYLVQHRVRDAAGLMDMLDEPLVITVIYVNKAPKANCTFSPPSPKAGQPVQFTDLSTDPDGPSDIVKWEWDFSFDSSTGFNVESTEKNPVHIYDTPGNYPVMLRVYDTANNVGQLNWPITVPVKP